MLTAQFRRGLVVFVFCLAAMILWPAGLAFADSTAPVTTSDAKGTYENEAVIHLSATDGETGVVSTQWVLYVRVTYSTIHIFANVKAFGGLSTVGSWQEFKCGTGKDISVSLNRDYRLEYWSVDGAGNKEVASNVTFKVIDTAKPTSTASISNVTLMDLTPIAFITVTSTDSCSGVASITCSVDGKPPVSVGGTLVGAGISLDVSEPGNHELRYWAVDKAGNTEDTKTSTFHVGESTAPVTLSDAKSSYDNSGTITLSATDPDSGVASTFYRLDGGEVKEAATLSFAHVGTHTLEYWSVDKLSNVEATKTANFTVRDTIKPVSSSDARTSYGSTATIALEASDNADGSGLASISWRIDAGETLQTSQATTTVSIGGVGQHSLEYWATDKSGNEEAHKIAIFVIVEAMIPEPPSSIRTSASRVRLGQSFVLSGDAGPIRMVGKIVVVWVKKPGKTYWTYSSNRVVYNNRGVASWYYRYVTKPGMARGTYSFKCTFAGNAAYPKSSTKAITVAVK